MAARRSDVEESYPGGADMEVVVEELGLYDHVTTGRQRHTSRPEPGVGYQVNRSMMTSGTRQDANKPLSLIKYL